MSIIVVEYPKPTKPESIWHHRRRTFLSRHPLPWHKGQQHETMCTICDAANARVCTINSSDADIVADRMLAALNAMAPCSDNDSDK